MNYLEGLFQDRKIIIVCKETGISPYMINVYINDPSSINNIDHAKALSNYFGVDYEEFTSKCGR